MSNDTFAPPAGSLAWRVCNWFGMSRNRSEERSPTELAVQFEASRKELMAALADCASAGLVVYTQGSAGYVYRAGPQLDAWVRGQTAPAAAPAPVKAAKRGGARKHLPPLDLAAIEVRTGVPLPERAGPGARPSWWPKVFEKLQQPGTSVVLPVEYMSGAKKLAQTHLKDKDGVKFEFRRLNENQFGIWRTA